jgi:DNA replication protein DnaC
LAEAEKPEVRTPIDAAILDRLVHNAHRLELRGDSMRKRRSQAPR